MKRSCKHIDITKVATIRNWVSWCVARHYKKRADFRKLLVSYGYDEAAEGYEEEKSWWNAIDSISLHIVNMIKNRKLELDPVRITEKVDKNSGKIRLIGCESALQQCMDYVAVFSCEEIWKRRIDTFQASSMPGKGQIYAKNLVRDALKKDNARVEYGKRHKIRYSRKYRFSAKTDIKKDFPSARYPRFIAVFKKDCANEDIIWLWEALLKTHRVYYTKPDGRTELYQGFMIGALTSQYAMIYMLSFASRRLREKVNFVACFMDDFVILDSNRKRMKDSILDMEKYLYEEFELTLKQNWSIQKIADDTPIDFVGYRIYPDGKVELRRRNWKKIRRYLLLPFLTFKQCKTIASLKGMIKHSSSYVIYRDYKFGKVWRKVRCILRMQSQTNALSA